MSKPFFEVFPTLKAGEDIRNMFEGAQVLKVTTNSDRTFLRVHIVSRHLIQKTLVYEMEHLIKNQLFGRSAVQVEIREKYELSGQYTPENVMAGVTGQLSCGAGYKKCCRTQYVAECEMYL